MSIGPLYSSGSIFYVTIEAYINRAFIILFIYNIYKFHIIILFFVILYFKFLKIKNTIHKLNYFLNKNKK